MIHTTLSPVKMNITCQHIFIGIYRSVNYHILGIIYRANHRYFLMPRQYSGIVKLMPPNTLTVYTNFPVAQFQFHLLHRRPLFQHKLYLGNLDARRDWGYAKDYVECMWLILQHDTPEDFVIATGEMHTVREFATLAFKETGIELRWEGEGVNEKGIDSQTGKVLVEVDPKYFRPSEVEQLLGDPTKAKTLLGWNPQQTSFEELVHIMAEHDMKFVRKLHLRSKEE